MTSLGPVCDHLRHVKIARICSNLVADRFEAKFHYAIWPQTGSKLVAAHPGIDLLNTRDETLNSGRCRRGRRTDVHLSVIGVRVTDKAGTRDDVEQFSRVQQKQQRANDRALWHSEGISVLIVSVNDPEWRNNCVISPNSVAFGAHCVKRYVHDVVTKKFTFAV